MPPIGSESTRRIWPRRIIWSWGTGRQVTLDWSEGEPAYHIYRSTVPANLIALSRLNFTFILDENVLS